ncbi:MULTISPECIES: dolichyl-phosphate-mannose--protein mannosyltransferase [unclassified Nostoc]|uniref:dolichyl-phosphate-mannose--protein mannosyltransferase n=1 Tax=unclassified Nostoc TaxID=2593658 RepID=UPI002AD251AF|nr:MULTISPECIES: phospholipid carrier-dependent glycosyltransferase [unclassified Nostoc]MDZ8126254.1 phospholipid carrier-dependent glycosyltransferase [Nostoc sp. CmiVER01]MDZ8227308.1 phospholipid carrier-dependent glycosyltransferase [Nostoc sp. ChiVER01]
MTKKWFRIGMVSVFLFSLALRFWGLERFNTLVFDEVYFAKFGNNYLTHTPFFNAHPPLSQYMIGIGIWIGSHIPFWHDTVNGLTGSLRSPWTYRWFNALTGSFIPLVVAAIAYQLSYRRSFALLAGFFTACDGIFLVESRYALSNIYIVIFGLLGHWFLLLALDNQNRRRSFWLVFAGIAFGASVGTKWNGLWFLSGAYIIWIVAWIIDLIYSFLNSKLFFTSSSLKDAGDRESRGSGEAGEVGVSTYSPSSPSSQTPLQNLTQLNIFQMLFYLGIIPALIYSLIWIPHLQLDKTYGFIAVHQQILKFHLHLGGNSPNVHPYCAAWYKWPLMTRPMAYYYQTAESTTEPLPVMGPPLPAGAGQVIYDVHAMGNPFLWWFGVAAMLFLVGMLVSQPVIFWLKEKRFSVPETLSVDTWIALYLVINYAANLLPWVEVTRCVFIYHYMCAVVFVFLAIAWFVDQCLRSYYQQLRALGVTITFIILAAFIFWMPIYLGLPLSPHDYKLRMWFNSWI